MNVLKISVDVTTTAPILNQDTTASVMLAIHSMGMDMRVMVRTMLTICCIVHAWSILLYVRKYSKHL